MASSRSLPTHSNELLPDVDLVDLQAPIHREAALHIGKNTARQTEAQALGLARLVSVVHPLASVSTFSHMDAGCFVAAGAVAAPAARLG